MRTEPKYRIYPSLLNLFQRLLDSDIDAESFRNIDPETGEPRRTADEIAEGRERELLDAVNRVRVPATEAQARGTAFNEIVDCLVAHRKPEVEGMEIWHDTLYVQGKGFDAICAGLEGFEFAFDEGLCRGAAAYVGKDAVAQHLCRGLLFTEWGLVELYGYADEIVRDRVLDFKTTTSYQFGKYEGGWQKLVYPYCLVQSGEMPSVSSFEYTVVQLTGPSERCPVMRGTLYREEYTYDHAHAEDRLRGVCEVFIGWLESHRDVITDTKIFGGDVSNKQ